MGPQEGHSVAMGPQERLSPRLLLLRFLASWAIMEESSEPEVALEITFFLELQLSPVVLNTGNSVALESHLGT